MIATVHAPALDAAQILHFIEHGWVLVSGLIPPAVAQAADAHTWNLLGLDPADATTWVEPKVAPYMPPSPPYAACYTTEMLTAAAQLMPDPLSFPLARAPDYAFVIRIMPQAGPWRSDHDLHVDGSSAGEHVNPFMSPWHLFAMIYLHDVAPKAARTVVWDRSHTKVLAHMKSDPARCKWVHLVDLAELDLGPPMEVPARAGDVLFFHPLLAHAKPMNVGGRPRFALNLKWPG